ncbi:MAG: TIGR00266 family protein [Clostridia bacterium]|nr:TIGR00266 family protein [Clostridia bacterium]
MQYQVKGEPLPYVEINLEAGEQIKCQRGAMSWMSAGIEMNTRGGGIGKMFSKAITGESVFENVYTARTPGYIAFASSLPGNILAVPVEHGKDIICQKSAYLAATTGVDISIFFHKRLGAGFFGGEGFIMQRLSGNGLAFVEIDGSVEVKELAAGESLYIDTGYLAMMDSTCSMDIQTVGSVKNAILGGEGIFNTVVRGPGRVFLQSMPVSKLSASLYMPQAGK